MCSCTYSHFVLELNWLFKKNINNIIAIKKIITFSFFPNVVFILKLGILRRPPSLL